MDLLIPCGLDGLEASARIVSVDDCVKGADYYCPQCRSPLILRDGEVRQKHLAHTRDTDCTNESVQHHAAKMMVAQVVNDWKQHGKQRPFIHRFCAVCKMRMARGIPRGVERAVVEHTIDGRWRADVALLDSRGEPVYVVEVHVTHRVTGEKRLMSVPWAEFDAKALLHKPHYWLPLEPEPTICSRCDERLERERRIEQREAEERRAREQREAAELRAKERQGLEEMQARERRESEERRVREERGRIEQEKRQEKMLSPWGVATKKLISIVGAQHEQTLEHPGCETGLLCCPKCDDLVLVRLAYEAYVGRHRSELREFGFQNTCPACEGSIADLFVDSTILPSEPIPPGSLSAAIVNQHALAWISEQIDNTDHPPRGQP